MATRFYLPVSGTPPLSSLAVSATWGRSENLVRYPCFTTKTNTSLTQKSANWAATATDDWVWVQYQSNILAAAYSWTTADTVSMVIKVAEAAAQVDSHLAYCIRVVSGDGATVRGTIGVFQATSSEYPTSLASIATRIHSARTDGASNFSSSVGDRIIIEIGHWGVTPTANTVYHNYGDPSATNDYALTDGLTTDLCPWVELSRTVVFGTPVTSSKSAYTRGGVVARYSAGYAPFPSITVLDDFNRASLGSQWVVNAGSPSIYNNSVLNLAGADIQYASGVHYPVEFFMTISGFPTDPQFYHIYLDYNSHNGTGSTKTMYRYAMGFIHNDGALDGVELQKFVNDAGPTNIVTTGAYTWTNGIGAVKFGLRHLDNGDIFIYLNRGSGWELMQTGNDSSIIASGWWRLHGGTDTGNEYFDDFALGHPQLGTGGKPAYVKGGTTATPTVRHAYIEGKSAGTQVTSHKDAYVKGKATTNSNKSAFVIGFDNRYYPSSDISTSGVWRNELKNTTNLYESINEPLPWIDSDYIYPDIVVTNNYYECKLGNPLSTPGSGAVVLFWRGNDQTGLGSKAKVELRQGITVLASGQQILTSVPTTYYIQLTPAQRTNISDWSDLRVRIIVAS